MHTKTRFAAALGGALAFAVAGTGIALAAVSGTPVTDTNGTAGYGAQAPVGQTFRNVQSTIRPDQYATTVKNGVLGVQLSGNPAAGACTAAQAGEVANMNSTFAVEYGVGMTGTAANPCPVGGSLAAADRHVFAGLGTVANTDTVWTSVTVGRTCQFRQRFNRFRFGNTFCRGHRFGNNTLTFYAQDLTTNSAVVTATLPVPPGTRFTGAAVGTQEDLAALANGPVTHRLATDNPLSPVDYFDATDQILVHFSYATATLNGGMPQSLDMLNASEAYADAAAGANSAANPAQVSAENSLSLTDTGPFGPASVGASAAGSDFTGWSANAGL